MATKRDLIDIKAECEELAFGLYIRFFHDSNCLLEIQVSNIRTEKNGEIKGVVYVNSYTAKRGFYSYPVTFNSSVSFSRFAKSFYQDVSLKAASIDIPEFIRQKVYGYVTKDDVIDFCYYQAKELGWLVEPFIYRESPTLLYAAKANGKTLFGCFISILLENFEINYKFSRDCGRVLYLDWEGHPDEIKSKMDSIVAFYKSKGEIVGDASYPLYKKCIGPLHQIIYTVRKVIVEQDVKLVIIDSLVPALGSNVNDSYMASQLFAVVAEINALGASALIFNHIAKHNMDSDNPAAWLGSVAYGNFCRIVWNAKAETIGNDFYITLSCSANNYGRLPEPLDFVFTFDDNSISNITVSTKTDDIRAMKIPDRIIVALKDGAKTLDEIVDFVFGQVTPSGKSKVKVTLSRLKNKGKVVNIEKNKWGLAYGSSV